MVKVLTRDQMEHMKREIATHYAANLTYGFEQMALRFGKTPQQIRGVYYRHLNNGKGATLFHLPNSNPNVKNKRIEREQAVPTMRTRAQGEATGMIGSALHRLRTRH